MSQFAINLIFVGGSFLLYILIAIWAKAGSTSDFYVAGGGVHPITNGAAIGADWMSAASFISMAGLIAAGGYANSTFLMGWTGGYVLLAMLLAPYLRKFGKFTVPEFIGDRFYSKNARLVAVICLIVASVTYVIGQMAGAGVAFSRFLEVDATMGLIIAAVVVFVYAVLGGMKGITYTQVAQYCVLIFAFMVPAIFISLMVADTAIPQIGFGSTPDGEELSLLARLDGLHEQLGFTSYTLGSGNTINLLAITFALMAGTAGLPHVIIRFYTVPSVRAARKSAGWALLFIAILYTTAPAVAVFARTNLIDTVENKSYAEIPDWFRKFRQTRPNARIAMYCTGGIRCEKSTAFALAEGLDEVYHLKGGILKYLEEVPQEQSLWRGDCFVFDNRVTVRHDLSEGEYDQCHACRNPVSLEDRQSEHYVPGISCPHCWDSLSEKTRAGARERQKQIELARQRNQPHPLGRDPRQSTLEN